MPVTRPRQFTALTAWCVLTFSAGGIGALASINAAEFYGTLAAPGWAPPAMVFGPVWSMLYLMMAIAIWRVWRVADHGLRRTAIGLFVVQLAFNALWSWLFFAWQRAALAFAEIGVLLILIALTLVCFWRLDRPAAWLLTPYLAWVTFAAALNFSLWRMNPTVFV